MDLGSEMCGGHPVQNIAWISLLNRSMWKNIQSGFLIADPSFFILVSL